MAHTQWRDHINSVQISDQLHSWLTDRLSLTYKLMSCCQKFQIRNLRQQRALCLTDECQKINLPRRLKTQKRDVILYCDGRPVVLGRTVVALNVASTWPFLSTLGENSLGIRLFRDPLVKRGQFQFTRLYHNHPISKCIHAMLGSDTFRYPLWARRSVFQRKTSLMLVTEVFLPEIKQLQYSLSYREFKKSLNFSKVI